MWDFVHCNNCFCLPIKGQIYSLTSCGHIFCKNCLTSIINNDFCHKCKSYTKVISFEDQIEPNINIFFKDSSQEMVKMIKIAAFQKIQMKHLNNHLIKENQRLNRLLKCSKKKNEFLIKKLANRTQFKVNSEIEESLKIKEESMDKENNFLKTKHMKYFDSSNDDNNFYGSNYGLNKWSQKENKLPSIFSFSQKISKARDHFVNQPYESFDPSIPVDIFNNATIISSKVIDKDFIKSLKKNSN